MRIFKERLRQYGFAETVIDSVQEDKLSEAQGKGDSDSYMKRDRWRDDELRVHDRNWEHRSYARISSERDFGEKDRSHAWKRDQQHVGRSPQEL